MNAKDADVSYEISHKNSLLSTMWQSAIRECPLYS